MRAENKIKSGLISILQVKGTDSILYVRFVNKSDALSELCENGRLPISEDARIGVQTDRSVFDASTSRFAATGMIATMVVVRIRFVFPSSFYAISNTQGQQKCSRLRVWRL